ncbi:MAG: DNA-binding transcriptional regulator, MocR family, contains an aminotransferase domain [Chloroflexi bacterium AL-N10]|nr:DNA-binding transcriptional regulator, MocR family, contains an aminotransferase domain [Chloroflexi bacterium AL-N10]NOK72831.1 DNA-binding transcriptional regulator, MocR family, contains an aminotransferase domain [Chloroflexi bacterium AL-N5]NOK88416.1 DNA-binding transcriptional regulator, MocR family, contains an aminotransferase domain [Chloroflexi bacterium AL-N15]
MQSTRSVPQSDSPVESCWSSAAQLLQHSTVRELLKVTEQADTISFAGGLPAPTSFPTEEIALATERVLAHQAARVLQYGPTEGFPPLRELLTTLMQARGITIDSDHVIVTSGSQQGLDLLGKLLIDPGNPILVENPTYVGALQAWRPYQPRCVTLPLDEDGLQIDGLEQALTNLAREGQRPKFLYIVSAFQNPTGTTLAADRRTALIDLAAQHNLLIIEDDPYGELRYSGNPQTPLVALDIQRWGAPRHVAYLSTFSKLLAPSLRVGWMIGPDALLQRAVQAKQGLDLHTGSLAQAIDYEACCDGLLERHTPSIRQIYHERRDAMLGALESHMPDDVRWTHPEGGMFLWLTLPEGLDSAVLLQQAIVRNVAFVPGTAFFANGGGINTLRLNFSHPTPDRIEEGIRRLAEVVNEGVRG